VGTGGAPRGEGRDGVCCRNGTIDGGGVAGHGGPDENDIMEAYKAGD